MIELKKELEVLYDVFFEEMHIDKASGLLEGKNKRFATMPYIGSNYLNAKKKILFVGLDIGQDEFYEENRFQTFDERNNSVNGPKLSEKNPHIAGTYGTALYFLKDIYNWSESWDILYSQNQFFKQVLEVYGNLLPNEVLSYVSLINYYKFVTKDRYNRAGAMDRVFLNQTVELDLLVKEINLLNPDILIFQSLTLRNDFLIKQLKDKMELYIGFHPSCFGRYIYKRIPSEYIKHLLEEGKIN
jgi:hypothetical protein